MCDLINKMTPKYIHGSHAWNNERMEHGVKKVTCFKNSAGNNVIIVPSYTKSANDYISAVNVIKM